MLLCQYPWNCTGTGTVSFHSMVGYVLVDSRYSGAVIVTVTYICMAIVAEDDGKLMDPILGTSSNLPDVVCASDFLAC